MRAVVYRKFGGVEVLQVEEVPAPLVTDKEVLVEVKATSLNVIDSRSRRGEMSPFVNGKFPKTPGVDFAGTVAAVGAKVTGLKVGDAVMGAKNPFQGGALAEMVAVAADAVIRKPEGLSFEVAAALPVTGLAALYSLRELGQLKSRQRVLIYGSSGGVGLAAIQLAKQMGAQVTTVCGPGGIEASRAMGADVTHDYKRGPVVLDGMFDVVMDLSGRFEFSKARAHMTPNGKYIDPSPTIPKVIGSMLANLFRSRKNLMLMAEAKRPDLEYLTKLVAQGSLDVRVAKVYPLSEVRQAFIAQESGGTLGKIVVAG